MTGKIDRSPENKRKTIAKGVWTGVDLAKIVGVSYPTILEAINAGGIKGKVLPGTNRTIYTRTDVEDWIGLDRAGDILGPRPSEFDTPKALRR